MKYLILASSILALVSCSSRNFKRDYTVVDSSHRDTPEWIEDFNEWQEDLDESDKSLYYRGQSEASMSRELACEVAKAKATGDVASEIEQKFKQELNAYKETSMSSSNSEYIQNQFSKIVKTSVIGMKTSKVYWEKRRFQKELGAKKDKDAFVCYSLGSISKSNLKKSIARAHKKLNMKLDSEHREVMNQVFKKI
jgi:hypothetical protein